MEPYWTLMEMTSLAGIRVTTPLAEMSTPRTPAATIVPTRFVVVVWTFEWRPRSRTGSIGDCMILLSLATHR